MASPPPTPKGSTSPDHDAEQARWFAISLDDAPPQRVSAVTAVLVKTWQADAGRLAAAAAVCRRRQCEGERDGWRETADLLERALQLVCSGAFLENSDGECAHMAIDRRG